jgi:predicted  nucleic acid-binding Zn-ribbon protein
MHKILEDRQREYVGLRKHYQVIEDAIRGTSYVQEIQERVQKAQVDSDYEASVAKDLQLVKQVDSASKDAHQWKSQADKFRAENERLSRDLDKASKKLVQ